MREYRDGCCSHWVLDGSNGKYVFADEIWKRGLLSSVVEVQKTCPMIVYAFCVLDGEAHFLVRQQKDRAGWAAGQVVEKFGEYVMRALGICDVPIKVSISFPGEMEDEELIALCIRIHLLPQQKRCVRRYSDYYWSSYREYFHSQDLGLTHTGAVLDLLDGNAGKARKKFAALHRQMLEWGQAGAECFPKDPGMGEKGQWKK